MDVLETYRQSFLKLLDETEIGLFQEIENEKSYLLDLSSISNTEMFFIEHRERINKLTNDQLKQLLLSLSNLERKYSRGREKDWYFVNTFSEFRSILFSRLDKTEKDELLDLFLKTRINERMPFAKDIELSINNLSKYKDYLDLDAKRRQRHIEQTKNEQNKIVEIEKFKRFHDEKSLKTNNIRQEYIKSFKSLSDKEKIKIIISEQKPLQYYSDEIETLNLNELTNLNKDEIGKFINIIKKSKDHRWTTILNRLKEIKTTDNDILKHQ